MRLKRKFIDSAIFYFNLSLMQCHWVLWRSRSDRCWSKYWWRKIRRIIFNLSVSREHTCDKMKGIKNSRFQLSYHGCEGKQGVEFFQLIFFIKKLKKYFLSNFFPKIFLKKVFKCLDLAFWMRWYVKSFSLISTCCCMRIFSQISRKFVWHKHSAYTKNQRSSAVLSNHHFSISLRRSEMSILRGVRLKMGSDAKIPSQVMECRFYKLTHLVRQNSKTHDNNFSYSLSRKFPLLQNWCNLFKWRREKYFGKIDFNEKWELEIFWLIIWVDDDGI